MRVNINSAVLQWADGCNGLEKKRASRVTYAIFMYLYRDCISTLTPCFIVLKLPSFGTEMYCIYNFATFRMQRRDFVHSFNVTESIVIIKNGV